MQPTIPEPIPVAEPDEKKPDAPALPLPPAALADLKGVYQQADDTYTIQLESGLTVKAKTIRDASAVMKIEKHCKTVQGLCAAGGMPEMRPYLPADPQVVKMCVYLEAFLVEPKVDFVQALDLAKTCGMLVPEIFAGMNQTISVKVAETQSEEVESAKND